MEEYDLGNGYYLDLDGMIWDGFRYLEENEKDELFPEYDVLANEVFWE